MDPDSIFDFPEAQQLLDQFASGQASLHVGGLGVEATDGTFTLGLIAHFRSPEFFVAVRRRAKANWESKRDKANKRPIQFMSLDGPGLSEKTQLGEMSTTSLFAIDLALTMLRDQQG